jgi:hypothetical protein
VFRLPAAAYGKCYGSRKVADPGCFFAAAVSGKWSWTIPGATVIRWIPRFCFVRDEVRDAGGRSVRPAKMNDRVDEQGRQEEEVHNEAGEAEAHGHGYHTEECVQQQPRRRQ